MTRVVLGIPCFQSVDYQVLEDYMRLAFHIGRRCQDIQLILGVKGKSEQFRARNAIVKAAIQTDAEFIWMLDDDHIIDVEASTIIQPYQAITSRYDILKKLIFNMHRNPNMGICGALYWQRGGECLPVVMEENNEGKPHFLHPFDISNRLQKVDVAGGGCMLIRTAVFDKIKEPWFAPEFEYGTDIQICKQVRAAGFEVWCDTSIEIGHLRMERDVLHSGKFKRRFVEVPKCKSA